MTKALWLPGADRTSQFFGGNLEGLVVPDLDKILLHSTETTGWPGYNGNGSNAPTLTVNPWTKKIRQHFVLNESARALVNPSSTSVSENKDKVCQIEIIGYSDKAVAKRIGRPGLDLRLLPDDSLRWLAGILVFIMREWTVPNVWATPFPWPEYPSSYGNTSSRMSSSEYDRFAGILGHLHASGNTHGDPTLDVVKLKRFVTEILTPAPPVQVPPTPAPSIGVSQETPDMFAYRLNVAGHTSPVIISDGFRCRWIPGTAQWERVKAGFKASTGRDLTVTTVASLDGVAVEWVGPKPSATYPIPASIKVVA
jgi:hypothetical protein